MNSKERVLLAVDLKMADKVPTDFHGTNIVINRLKKYFKVNTYRAVLDKLGSDIIDIRGTIDPIWNGPKKKEIILKNGVIENYLGLRSKAVQTQFGIVYEHCDSIFEDAQSPEDFDKFMWPQVEWFDFSNMKEELKEYKDLAIMASGVSIYQHPTIVRGIDNLLVDMMINEELAENLMDRYTNFYLKYYEKMFMETDGMIDLMRVADDFGMQDRLLISPDLFRKLIKPRLKKFTQMAHSYGVKVMFHSCGSIIDFIDDIIDSGVDILDPIQTRAKGMDPTFIKSTFGNRICLHGSIDTQYTLPQGNKKDIKEEVIARIEKLGPKGFIISPSHVVQPDVPLENIITLYKSIREYR